MKKKEIIHSMTLDKTAQLIQKGNQVWTLNITAHEWQYSCWFLKQNKFCAEAKKSSTWQILSTNNAVDSHALTNKSAHTTFYFSDVFKNKYELIGTSADAETTSLISSW